MVDVSLLSSAVWTLSSDILSSTVKEPANPAKKPNRRLDGYRTKDDRLIIVSFLNEGHFPGFCAAIGRANLAADPRFSNRDSRAANLAAFEAEMKATIASRTYTEWCEILRQPRPLGRPWDAAAEVANDPQVVANNYLVELDSGQGFSFKLASLPAQFNETPITPARAPKVGERSGKSCWIRARRKRKS